MKGIQQVSYLDKHSQLFSPLWSREFLGKDLPVNGSFHNTFLVKDGVGIDESEEGKFSLDKLDINGDTLDESLVVDRHFAVSYAAVALCICEIS